VGGATLTLATTQVLSQQAEGQEMPEEARAMVEMWTKLATPGPEHARLKELAGDWKQRQEWMMEPGGPPTTSESEGESEMILGGRFLLQRAKGAPMPMFGDQPFEGIGLMGFDNYSKKYMSVWADNYGTLMMYMEGQGDASGKEITFDGDFNDPMTKSKKKMRWVYRTVSKDKYEFEMFEPGPDGKMWRSFHMVCDRD
jgi:hypothetical protein